jgi:hypothetical protein
VSVVALWLQRLKLHPACLHIPYGRPTDEIKKNYTAVAWRVGIVLYNQEAEVHADWVVFDHFKVMITIIETPLGSTPYSHVICPYRAKSTVFISISYLQGKPKKNWSWTGAVYSCVWYNHSSSPIHPATGLSCFILISPQVPSS